MHPLGEMHEIFLSDILGDVGGGLDKMVGMIYCKSPLKLVVFWPKTLIGGIELLVVGVTDEEVDEHFAVLKGVRVVIEGVFKIHLDKLPFDVFGIGRRV